MYSPNAEIHRRQITAGSIPGILFFFLCFFTAVYMIPQAISTKTPMNAAALSALQTFTADLFFPIFVSSS